MWTLWNNIYSYKQFLTILWSEVWKGRFQLMLILVLLGMYFDAVVAFVTSKTLLSRLALVILWGGIPYSKELTGNSCNWNVNKLVFFKNGRQSPPKSRFGQETHKIGTIKTFPFQKWQNISQPMDEIPDPVLIF